MTKATKLKAPFPYFGGKSRVASLVWERFGDVANYIEPFAGSLAVLLARPADHDGYLETVNDMDGLISNFWRSMALRPDEVARHALGPVIELDLHARRQYLTDAKPSIEHALRADPEWCDPKLAGWWVHGRGAWQGSGWTAAPKNGAPRDSPKAPRLAHAHGIHCPSGRAALLELRPRLERTRVMCGDWRRTLSKSATGAPRRTVGVFLDPPYDNAMRQNGLYARDDGSVAADVLAWALEHGDTPHLRICVAGYVGEHDALEAAGWSVHAWKSSGTNATNAAKERLWFSPHCLASADALELAV